MIAKTIIPLGTSHIQSPGGNALYSFVQRRMDQVQKTDPTVTARMIIAVIVPRGIVLSMPRPLSLHIGIAVSVLRKGKVFPGRQHDPRHGAIGIPNPVGDEARRKLAHSPNVASALRQLHPFGLLERAGDF